MQRYLPTQDRQDIRVMVIDKKVVGAMQMKPVEGDFRANFHLTHKSRPFELTPLLEKIGRQGNPGHWP